MSIHTTRVRSAEDQSTSNYTFYSCIKSIEIGETTENRTEVVQDEYVKTATAGSCSRDLQRWKLWIDNQSSDLKESTNRNVSTWLTELHPIDCCEPRLRDDTECRLCQIHEYAWHSCRRDRYVVSKDSMPQASSSGELACVAIHRGICTLHEASRKSQSPPTRSHGWFYFHMRHGRTSLLLVVDMRSIQVSTPINECLIIEHLLHWKTRT